MPLNDALVAIPGMQEGCRDMVNRTLHCGRIESRTGANGEDRVGAAIRTFRHILRPRRNRPVGRASASGLPGQDFEAFISGPVSRASVTLRPMAVAQATANGLRSRFAPVGLSASLAST